MADTHSAIKKLVKRIRNETECAAQDVNPNGPGTSARILVMLEVPGPAAVASGLLSTTNQDGTTRNQVRLMARAKFDERSALFWNAVPWSMDRRDIRKPHRIRGATYLKDLLALFPADAQPIIVACGRAAQDVCGLAGVDAIPAPHPSNQGLSGGVTGARATNEARYVAALQEAKAKAEAQKKRKR